MTKKRTQIIMIGLMMLLILVGCSPKTTESNQLTQDELKTLNDRIKTLEDEVSSLTAALKTSEIDNDALAQEIAALKSNSTSTTPSLLTTSLNVLAALETKDMNALATYTDPSLGIRFSPYAYVDVANDLVFQTSVFPQLLNDTTVYTWGSFDGSGEPMSMTFEAYFDDFVYDADYLNPHVIGLNQIIGQGNTLVNLSTEYPNAEFVEFHFTGFDSQYEGIDWSSLILVFDTTNGYKLIGIVHNQWTI